MFELFVLWFLVWGIVAFFVYKSAKNSDIDAGLWAVIIFIFGIFGLIGYFILLSLKTSSGNRYVTPQYERYIKTEKKETNSEKGSKPYKEGFDKALELGNLPNEELYNILSLIEKRDISIETFGTNRLLFNHVFRKGFEDGINNILQEKATASSSFDKFKGKMKL